MMETVGERSPRGSPASFVTRVIFHCYYTGMRRCFSLALGLVVLLAACDRGSRPARSGTSAPEFTVKDSDRTVSLHDFRGKTRVVNVWATGSPPCLEEVP